MPIFDVHKVPPDPGPDNDPLPDRGPTPDTEPVPDPNPVAPVSDRPE
ncbi:MAG: hypothetical protein V7642_5103 [Burkholderiales bacterium]|jgi:serine protease autotransporter